MELSDRAIAWVPGPGLDVQHWITGWRAVEAEGSEVEGHPWAHSEFKDSPGCLKSVLQDTVSKKQKNIHSKGEKTMQYEVLNGFKA